MALAAPAQEQGQLDGSPTLFAVMAAINAAGYDADLNSPSSHPIRQALRGALAQKKIAVLPELRRFVEAHKAEMRGAELSKFISYALSVGPPPEFAPRYKETEMPPDAAALEGFQPLLARFYEEADVPELWRQAQAAYDREIERYHGPVSRAILESNAYLRTASAPALGRRFQIYVDLLAAPNQVHTRNYKDDYFVVVTPSADPQIDHIRQAYLQYMLDPMMMRYSDPIRRQRAIGDYALAAPLLEEHYKRDFLLLATRSLIRAVESRLAPRAMRQGMVDQALKEGFVLAPFFEEALLDYEKQEQAFSLYLPTIVKTLDMGTEEKRLQNVEFTQTRPEPAARATPKPVAPAGLEKSLLEAEQFAAEKEFEKARILFLRVLNGQPELPLKARSYFGLARIATLQNDPETAEKLFQQALESQPDAATKAWSHVYLARLSDLAGEEEEAAGQYRAALSIEGAPDQARKMAENGLAGAFRRK